MAREMERRKQIQRMKSQESRQSTKVNKKIRDENGNKTLIGIYSLLDIFILFGHILMKGI